MDRIAAKAALEALVARRRTTRYTNRTSESDIRSTLIEPLLHDVLGWDTAELDEYSREAYSRGAGYADSVCLHNGAPVIFWEAKRLGAIPAVTDLRRARKFYSEGEEQALRYARRSAAMKQGERWTVLVNFDRVHVFEATTEERVLTFESPEDLLDRFDELLLLSKDAVVGGVLVREVARRKKPDIDEEFRDALNSWRLSLAQDIYDQGPPTFTAADGAPDLGPLQAAVQRLLDRLIILQFASDVDALGDEDPLRELLRLTEPAPDSRALVPRPTLRASLMEVFRRFDGFYNTTLFSPGHPVETMPISDPVLRAIVDGIASQSFRRLDADILGATYETYLGHQLRLRDGRMLLELRPELRRQGGVYYTPRHVVDEIVGRTLRPLLEGATTVADVDAIRVIDPACGSGSFLIRAFDAFADWYDAENVQRAQRSAATGQATLADIEDLPISGYGRRILERNLYGVDLDPEAAEIATVNLVLQALRRGRGQVELGRLPLILGQNIKVGNSVVPGYAGASEAVQAELRGLEGERRALLLARASVRELTDSSEERARLAAEDQSAMAHRARPMEALSAEGVRETRRPFFWQLEFPEVFDPVLPVEQQGFSVVVGNPPWIGFYGANEDRPYLEAHYQTAVGRFDIYVPFIELAIGLLKPGGRLGLITPSNFFLRDYGVVLRRVLRDEVTVETVLDYGHAQLFRGATNYPAILIAVNATPREDTMLTYIRVGDSTGRGRAHPQVELPDSGWVFLTEDEASLIAHVDGVGATKLGDICRLNRSESGLAEGVITGNNGVFLLDRDTVAGHGIESTFLRECVKGEDVRRWSIPAPKRLLIYPYDADGLVAEDRLRDVAPNTHRWLSFYRPRRSPAGLAGRDYFDRSGKEWYELWNERREGLLSVPKLLTAEVSDRPRFALVGSAIAFTNSVTSANPTASSGVCREYLAGVLNSRLMAIYHSRHSVPKANGFLIYTPAFLENLPIAMPDMANEAERELHDGVVGSVTELGDVVTRRRDLVTDFKYYVDELPVAADTVHTLLNRFRADAREVLVAEPGTLHDVGIRRDGASIVVTGRCRLSGVAYGHGEFDTLDLLRATIPEPFATFLERLIPGSTRFGRGVRGRSLGSRAGDVIIPTVDETGMRAALARYEPILAEAHRLDARGAELETVVDELVVQLYRLTPEMIETLAVAELPADRIGVSLGASPDDDEPPLAPSRTPSP